jgi:hypothetical protein
MTDMQALILIPTVNQGLRSNEHVFIRVGILTAIYAILGDFGTWFDDVKEPIEVTPL